MTSPSGVSSLLRPQTKSDEEEDEYFDVSESEPPALPSSPPPTLVADLVPPTKTTRPQDSTPAILTTTTKAIPPPQPSEEPSSIASKVIVLPKIVPVVRPSVLSPKPVIRVTTPTDGGKTLDSMVVSKVKPTVPFKPLRTSLSPKDALPNRGNSLLVVRRSHGNFQKLPKDCLRSFVRTTQNMH